MLARPDIFALDATARPRPGGVGLASLVADIRCHYPDLLLLADIACVAEDVEAEKPGFDFVGTGLHGYIHETMGKKRPGDHFQVLREGLAAVKLPVIAEGGVDTPEMAAQCLACGAYAVVVGGGITRP